MEFESGLFTILESVPFIIVCKIADYLPGYKDESDFLITDYSTQSMTMVVSANDLTAYTEPSMIARLATKGFNLDATPYIRLYQRYSLTTLRHVISLPVHMIKHMYENDAPLFFKIDGATEEPLDNMPAGVIHYLETFGIDPDTLLLDLELKGKSSNKAILKRFGDINSNLNDTLNDLGINLS